MQDELAEHVAGVGALMEPARRTLYLYVAAQSDAVSREQAAAAVDLPLHTAKFHLDKLVEEGLLDAEFRRLSGKTGPGAGRPAKLYRRSSRQFSVSLPERRYDLAGHVLAAAIERALHHRALHGAASVEDAVSAAAEQEGRRIADTGEPGESDVLHRAAAVLARHGYEPRVTEGEIRLANCPFDRLATDHRDLVCGMNLALIRGVIDGLDVPQLEAELSPQPGFCCVTIRG